MTQRNQFQLMRERRFAPFFWTQFLGAFNDNVFKTALLTALTFDTLSWTTMDIGLLNQLIPGLFILPFVVLSATSGQLADKIEKGRMARAVKLLEIVIMLVAAYGWLNHQLWLLIGGIAGMGIHSTIFGPVKYAYLPQHLQTGELIGGNGLIEMGTFVGILLGEVLGAMLVVHKPWGIELVAGGTVTIAIVGLLCSLRIPDSPAPAPELKINWNPLTETFRNLSFSKKNRPVFLSLLGNSWFWFYGAIVLAQFPVFAKDYLHGDHGVFILLLTIFSFGIGAGSLLCEKMSGHKVEIGLVPFGAIGMTVFGIELYLASNAYTAAAAQVDIQAFFHSAGAIRLLLDVMLLGVFGGLYIVPLFAVIQTRSERAHLSRTIAGMNILNALFMVTASLAASAMLVRGMTIPQIFLATAILNGLVAIYIFSLVPEFLMRFIAWLALKTIHRVKTVELDRIPEEGAAILVCNHVSYLDAVVIMAASPRPIRFVMDHRIFKKPLMSWIFRTAKAIPIAPASEDPWLLEKSFIDVAQALHEGELVCIFPEGKLTSDGDMNEFKGGLLKILERSPVPVYPMALRGLWGSIFSRRPENPIGRVFRRGILSRLELVVGQRVEAQDVDLSSLRQTVESLRGQHK